MTKRIAMNNLYFKVYNVPDKKKRNIAKFVRPVRRNLNINSIKR